jgi:hypothetical protein
VKPGREGPTVPVQLRGGLQSPNTTVTLVGTITIRMAMSVVCIDNAPNTSLIAMSRSFVVLTGKRPSSGLYSRHTGSHCIDDPLDMGPYIQQDNI